MPRFARRQIEWITVTAIFGSGAGFLLAAYLLAGLTGFLD